MIAHIRQPKQPESESVAPMVRARQMVAETLLPDETTEPRHRVAVRKIAICGGLMLLAMLVALAYYSWR